MHIQPVEIFSDASNAVIIRHPDRSFPGVLIQGDTLNIIIGNLQPLLNEAKSRSSISEDSVDELEGVIDQLKDLRTHYINVLQAHGLELPFSSNQRT